MLGCALGRVRVLFLLSMAVSDGFSHCNRPFLDLRNRLIWTECLTELAFRAGFPSWLSRLGLIALNRTPFTRFGRETIDIECLYEREERPSWPSHGFYV
jgi:hypothetical protein